MARFTIATIVAVACLMPAGPTAAQMEQVSAVTMTPSVAQTLESLSDTATVEHARCLLGRRGARGVIEFDSVVDPGTLSRSTAFSVNPGPCPPHALAIWHLHLPYDLTLTGLPVPGSAPRETYCYLSELDQHWAQQEEAPPLQVVGVGAHRHCWFTRASVAAAPFTVMLRPAPGHWVIIPRGGD